MQVGMLHATYERGIVPDLLVATSVGALNAAFIAWRPQTVATARELGRVWRNLQREDILPVSVSALVGGFAGDETTWPRSGFAPARARAGRVPELADAVIPLHLVAFDLIERPDVLLSEGPAVETNSQPTRSSFCRHGSWAAPPSDRQRLHWTRPSTASASWSTAGLRAISPGTQERSTSSSSRVRTAPGCTDQLRAP